MRCEEFERIVFSGGEVTPQMRGHARECEACRALMENADVLSGARELDRDMEVPASFARGWRARVRGAAAMRRPGLTERMTDWLTGLNRRSLLRGAAVAACAVVFLGVGVQLGSRADVSAQSAAKVSIARSAASGTSYGTSVMYDGVSYDAVAESANADSGAAAGSEAESKIVRTAQMSVDVEDMDAAVAAIRERTQALGGTVDSCEISGRKEEGRWASLSLSIPSEALDAFLSGAGELGTVTREASQTTDMTGQYYDNESRLESALAQKQRLDELYAQAQDMSDIIEITDALYNLQWEIDSLTGANQRIDTRVALSQVTLTLNEAESEVQEEQDFVTRMKESVQDGLASLVEFAQAVVLFAVWALPWLAVIALLALAAWLVGRHIGKRKR